MTISLGDLYLASTRVSRPTVRSLAEAKERGAKTVFLCHSRRDAGLVKGLVNLLSEAGWDAYIDWSDTEIPPTPNRETAARLQKKIIELEYFLYLATPSSKESRWCPWEIGYANGTKHIEKIIVCPTTDGNVTHGSEYLELYRRLDVSSSRQLSVWQPGMTRGIPVTQL